MRHFRTVLGAAFACVLLANCAYFDKAEAPAAERIDVTADSQGVDVFQSPSANVSAQEAKDFVVSQGSNNALGSVEVYDFAKPAPQQTAYRAAPLAEGLAQPVDLAGSPYTDESVEIYSFDAQTSASPQVATSGPTPLPPASWAAAVQSKGYNATGGSGLFNSERAAKIYFAHGSKHINENGEGVLSRLSSEIKGTGQPIKVSGYSSQPAGTDDEVERKIKNLKVSMDRAYAVTTNLIRKGIPSETIETTGWGEANPAQPVGALDAESASRRVEITAR